MRFFKRGFTIIEFIIYIGITSILLIATLTFAFVIINDQIKQSRIMEVNNIGSFVIGKIAYYTTRADSVDAATNYNTNPGKLVLNNGANPQITFDTYAKTLQLNGGNVEIIKLRMKIGTGTAVDITSDKVSVTNFTLTNASGSGGTTVQVNLTVSSVNPSATNIYAAENYWNNAFTLRKK